MTNFHRHPAKLAHSPKVSEATIQAAVVRHLQARAMPDVVWFAVPNGGSRHRVEAARLVGQGVVPGVPDIVLIREGHAYGLELKAAAGVVSPAQKAMHERWQRAGGSVAVAKGLDAALEQLEAWELIRPAQVPVWAKSESRV